jgi:hypothetical protein
MKVGIGISLIIWALLALSFLGGMYFNKPAEASPVIKPVTCVVELYAKPREAHEYHGTLQRRA